MKNLKNFILPAAFAVLGVGSAFASKPAKTNDAAIVDGHVKRPNEQVKCQNTHIRCSTTGTQTCTADVGMGPEILYNLVGTSCPTELYFQ
ncbi:DUF6520 family protein [Chryseobacterium salivictor]|uniref:Uncharacterized protein n=1 Tax=Chryseobacterium salivictor TaxID=2547600 RepID=A0A4P6ZHZ2_9FLAO|nr:DUF6520 family protein [Chryseobacterium salivictor]QBO59343.1 hypothetical protein NBC122_02539 [Chryseobacterium salivictor]